MTVSANDFDDLRAPEVVKPLSSKQPAKRREKEEPPPVPDPQDPHQQTPKNKGNTTAPPVNPKQPTPSASRTKRSAPPSLPSEREKQTKSQEKKTTKNFTPKPRTWMAVPIVAGVALLFGFLASIPTRKNETTITPTTQTHAPEQVEPKARNSPTPEDPIPPPQTAVPIKQAPPPTPPTGKFQLSAFAAATNGQRHVITGKADFELRSCETSSAIKTNVAIPCMWSGIPIGEYRISVNIAGYRPCTNQIVNVVTDATGEVALALQPIPATVHFFFPATTTTTFSVYNEARLLGTSQTTYDVPPFVANVLTFKAVGWRDTRVNVQVDKPGVRYECPIPTERVQAGMGVKVISSKGEMIKSGLLSLNGEKPFAAAFPLERPALPTTGTLRIVLAIDGYQVMNNTQTVVLVDRQMTNVVFMVERKSWVSRMFTYSAPTPQNE